MTPEKDQLHKELSDFMRGTGWLPFDAVPDELDDLEGIQKLVVKVAIQILDDWGTIAFDCLLDPEP